VGGYRCLGPARGVERVSGCSFIVVLSSLSLSSMVVVKGGWLLMLVVAGGRSGGS
jgi:hypothetical protein